MATDTLKKRYLILLDLLVTIFILLTQQLIELYHYKKNENILDVMVEPFYEWVVEKMHGMVQN